MRARGTESLRGGTHDKIADLISMYGIRLPDLSEYRVDGLVRYMMNDKKTTSGTIRFYVPAQSNTVSEMPLSQDQARRVLREYIQNQGGISH
ncbi:3-dehydroquinate synthase [Thermogymnomonas acidicola]|uniref:3-dehydroquinate synthase n=1 Tax=Thermogymnomonas acidicola TaxID=399579 RepID=UPI001396C67C|nr:3-dehydroquinate synthase [Thermogymnomonas acidicola]